MASLDDKHKAVTEIARGLKHSPSLKGFVHLAGDGVYRSFSSTGEVVDYKQLNPSEIAAMVEFTKDYTDSDTSQKMSEKFKGVDGTTVTDQQQLLHPEGDLLPVKFRK